MQLHALKGPAGSTSDRLICERADGSCTQVEMPRQGILPHDLLHALVETALEFDNGFMGRVAAGADIGFLSKTFHDFADPQRTAQSPQAESVVEALQTQLWQGAFDLVAFDYGVETACAMRGVPIPTWPHAQASLQLFQRAQALGARWQALAENSDLRLSFPLPQEAC